MIDYVDLDDLENRCGVGQEDEPLGAAGDSAAKSLIKASPFIWRDPATFPRRRWIYGRHQIRRFTSATFAPGGVGKTTLVLAEGLCVATGRNLLGVECHEGPLRVWVLNLEDPEEEIARRIAAICIHFDIDPKSFAGRLFINSGRDTPVCVATQDRNGITIATPVVDALTSEIKANKIDLVIIDPFVSVHRVGESDNGAVDAVAKVFGRIADECNCAIELVHHVRKAPSAGGYTVEDGRGAVALLAAVRSARVLNGMSQDEAEKAGVDKPRTFFRVQNGKANLAPPPDNADWYQLVSVSLSNGGANVFEPPDHVAVASSWEWPNAMDEVKVADLRKIQMRVNAGEWRDNVQTKEKWVGCAVAQVMKLDWEDKAARTKINGMLKVWYKTGMLKRVDKPDARRDIRTFVEVGTWATD